MRRRAFPGSGHEVEQRYIAAGQWLKATIFDNAHAREWCAKNGMPVVKANSEGIDSAGEFLVPTILADAIYDLRESYGVFRQTARLAPMASNAEVIARRTGGATAVFMGENTSATATTANYDRVSLVAKKIGALVQISSELAEDSLADIVNTIANEIAWAFASKEDDCAFNGDGTSTYGRMVGLSQIVLDGNHAKAKVTATAGHNTFTLLDGTDVAALMAAVQASAFGNAAFFISQVGFAACLCRLAQTHGAIGSITENGRTIPTYLGFPVRLTAKLPVLTSSLTGKVMMAFGDMYQGAVLGQRRGITLAQSADRYLDQDQIAILGTQRFHSVIHDAGDNTNVGTIAALVAP